MLLAENTNQKSFDAYFCYESEH